MRRMDAGTGVESVRKAADKLERGARKAKASEELTVGLPLPLFSMSLLPVQTIEFSPLD